MAPAFLMPSRENLWYKHGEDGAMERASARVKALEMRVAWVSDALCAMDRTRRKDTVRKLKQPRENSCLQNDGSSTWPSPPLSNIKSQCSHQSSSCTRSWTSSLSGPCTSSSADFFVISFITSFILCTRSLLSTCTGAIISLILKKAFKNGLASFLHQHLFHVLVAQVRKLLARNALATSLQFLSPVPSLTHCSRSSLHPECSSRLYMTRHQLQWSVLECGDSFQRLFPSFC